MNSEFVTAIYRQAWTGIDGKPNGERVRDRYLHRLREARTDPNRREVCVELLAEGLIGAGGSPDFQGEQCLTLWRLGESDGWQVVRDCALLASAISAD